MGRFHLIVYKLEFRVELIAHAWLLYLFCISVGTVHVSGSMFSSPSPTLLEMHILAQYLQNKSYSYYYLFMNFSYKYDTFSSISPILSWQ